MRFDVITIFPELCDSYFNESIIKRARKKKLVSVYTHNLRDFTRDKHKSVDDKPYGGGAGMVMAVDPIYRAVEKIRTTRRGKQTRVILFSAKGKKFDQRRAHEFLKYDQIIMICGRYEGIDERIAKHVADIELSVGDYILTGGEIPAMIVVDAVTRLVPGAINEGSIEENRLKTPRDKKKGLEVVSHPMYTRPESYSPRKGISWKVPRVLLSGDHKKIFEWHEKNRRVLGG